MLQGSAHAEAEPDYGSTKPTVTSHDEPFCFCFIKQELLGTVRSHSSHAAGYVLLCRIKTTGNNSLKIWGEEPRQVWQWWYGSS